MTEQKTRTLYRNGGLQIRMTILGVLCLVIGFTVIVRAIFVPDSSWSMLKLFAWAEGVMAITRDTVAEVLV